MKLKIFAMSRSAWLLSTLVLGLLVSSTPSAIGGQQITLPTDSTARWLELREVKGKVTIQATGGTRAARIGDRLQKIGEQVSTGSGSEAVLVVDTGIGIVRLTEGTILQIKQLQVTQTGGRITLLSVPQGLARLQVRSFTNPASRLEIKTPAGVAGVRGTEFGVGVTPNGKTTVATKEGKVATSAQEETVLIGAGFYSLVVPGQPPTPPQVIRENMRLEVQQLQVLPPTPNVAAQVRLIGRVEPSNALFLDGQSVDLNSEGRFETIVPLPSDRRIQAIVRSPFGSKQTYTLKALVNP